MNSEHIKEALRLKATSKTLKNFVNTPVFKEQFPKYINTCKAIILAANGDKTVHVNESIFRVEDYEVPAIVVTLCDHYNVYLNERAARSCNPILVSTIKTDDSVGYLTPVYFKNFQELFNEAQNDNKIPCSSKVENVKTILLHDLGPVTFKDNTYVIGSSEISDDKEILSQILKYDVPKGLLPYAHKFDKLSDEAVVECLDSMF